MTQSTVTERANRLAERNRGTGAAAILVLLFAVLPLIMGYYTLHIFIRIYLNFIVIIGLMVILGFSKQFSLGQVAFYGIGAYTTALLTKNLGVNFFPALLLSGLVAGLVSIIIAIPGTRFKGPWLALITYAFAEITRILFARLKNITGGFAGFFGIPRPSLGGFEFGSNLSFYYLVYPIAVLVVIAAFRIKKSALGATWMSVGDDENIAMSVGINVFANKLLAFAAGSVFAGIAGSIYAGYANFISPDLFTLNNTIFYLTILIVGGMESIPGALISVILFTFLQNYLKAFYPWDMVLYGVIIVLVINLLPQGLGSIVASLFSKLNRRKELTGSEQA